MTDTITPGVTAIPDLTDWRACDAARRRLWEELRPANKARLFDVLAAASITSVIVSFDGYGDSGQIERIEARRGDDLADLPDNEVEIVTAEWGVPEPQASMMTLAAAIEHLA